MKIIVIENMKRCEATNTDRKSDPLKEYSDKEALTPSKIKEHKPTAVKRDPNYQTKTEQGQPSTKANKQMKDTESAYDQSWR